MSGIMEQKSTKDAEDNAIRSALFGGNGLDPFFSVISAVSC